jgi:hypothetical protein
MKVEWKHVKYKYKMKKHNVFPLDFHDTNYIIEYLIGTTSCVNFLNETNPPTPLGEKWNTIKI